MAVPKKRISRSRAGMRRGGNKAYKTTFPNVIIDKTTGEYKLPHHISLDGYYKGKKVVLDKKKKENKDNQGNKEEPKPKKVESKEKKEGKKTPKQ